MRLILFLSIFALSCTSSGSTEGSGGTGGAPSLPNCDDHVVDPDGPPKNPFLADSIYGIPHGMEDEEAFSLSEADGAWTVRYSNIRDEVAGEGGLGTGATPSLIGFGDDEDKFAQSEQSVVVSGYGAVVVNNEPRNVPESAPAQATRLYSSFHCVVGGARYNSLFSGVHLDQEGRIIYGNPFGKLRLDVN